MRAIGAADVLDIDLLAEPFAQSPSATSRPITSVPPPAGKGTIALICRVGARPAGHGERRRRAEQRQSGRTSSRFSSSSSLVVLERLLQTAAAIASPISCVLAVPPRSRVSFLPSAITFVTAACMRSAAAVAFGSLCLRPRKAISICPDMIMA